MFRDNYTNFSFDEQDSSSFKVWITNKNDLKRNMSPNFSDKFNAPTYGGIRYYEGTTIDKQDFKFSCVAVDVTLNEWRAITEWLSPLKIGKLRFDWNDKYYYMTKISKAPSGTMFIKGQIDSIMGPLYIITFDLELTTVGDWAALGEYGVQPKFDLDNSDNVNLSVFNNPYYMPSIVERVAKTESVDELPINDIFGGYDSVSFSFDVSDEVSFEWGQSFGSPLKDVQYYSNFFASFAKSFLTPKTMTTTLTCSSTEIAEKIIEITGESSEVLLTLDNNSIQYNIQDAGEYWKVELIVSVDGSSTGGIVVEWLTYLIGSHNLSLKVSVSESIPKGTSLAQIKNLDNAVVGEIAYCNATSYYYRQYLDNSLSNYVEYIYTEKHDGYFHIPLAPTEYLVSTSTYKISYKGVNLNKTLVVNSGSLPSYPNFYTQGQTASIYYNDKQIMYYSSPLASNKYLSLVETNTKNCTITSFGLPIEILKDNNGSYVYNSDLINKIDVDIKSGRPELLKCILKNFHTSDDSTTLQFYINGPTVYNRYNPCLVHIFQKDFSERVNVFNRDEYGSLPYYSDYEDFLHILVGNPLIKIIKMSGGYVLELKFLSNHLIDNYNTHPEKLYTENSIGKTFYISVCDYEEFRITASDSSTPYKTGLQLREVI